MYPNLYYAFKDLFGVDFKFLRFVNSFGFFMAISFIAAAITLSLELKRKEREGLLESKEELIVVGKPASIAELVINFILGFLLGYKIVGLFLSESASNSSPQEFIFSSQGNLPVGLLLGFLFAGLKWWEKNKQKLTKPEERKIRIWPHDRVGDLTIYAAVFGFLGAKIFDILESPSDFFQSIKDLQEGRQDAASLIFSGLTFYGGLICAALAIWYYAKKNNIGFWYLNDATAPGLMLAYALGRIGCQVAGDGDWGVPNTKPNPFHWLPNWMWSYNYPHNVINKGDAIPGCVGQFCSQLRDAVFPTPFYETIVCLILFFIIWSLRKRFKVPGTLFAFYLVLNGVERFFIEKIRVNVTYTIFGFHPTQAEIISSLLVIIGVLLYFFLKKKANNPTLPTA
jgi:phosphatidylglycerol---prolipoprotein diacylglyceryl transferase